MRTKAVAGLLLVLFASMCIYVSSTFVFNPFTYRPNELTNLPWSWYRGPLQVEYGVLEDGGWRFVKVADTSIAKDLFRELGRSSLATFWPQDAAESQGRPVWFGVRRVSDGAVLLDAKGCEGSDTFLLRGQIAVSVTPALLELLSTRLPGTRQ